MPGDTPMSSQETRDAVAWLATLLGTTTTPTGYTVALFHEGTSPIEHFTISGRPIDDDAELLLAAIQFVVLNHQVAHFARQASNDDWEAAMARLTEAGDFGGNLTVEKMRDFREELRTGIPDSVMAALAAALHGDKEAAHRLLGAPEQEPGTIRSEAITYL
jgi:hypothetical protein